MLVLNLLSDEQKQKIKTRKTNLIIKKIILSLLALTMMSSVLLLVAQIFIQNNLNKIETIEYMSDNKLNKDIIHVNNLTKFLKKINNEHRYWSDVLIEISKITNNNIKLSSLQINQESNSIIIKGLANNRDDLLLLKKNMENSNLFKDVYLPIQNLVQKTNTEFSLQANFIN